MAKKVAKKEAPAAKAKKPAAKAAVKPAKATKPAPKAAAKPAAKPVAKKAAPAKPVAKAPAKAVKPEVKPVKAVEKPKAPTVEKAPKAEKKSAAPASVEVEAPKKEKKVKLDKTGMTEDQVKWHELHEKYKGTKAPAYTISSQYEAKTPVEHKIFGWGYILSNEYDRLEVLFEDGKRMLISNRKLT